ncbi:MAG TPA: transcriptional repressor [Candidatus Acutalibacter pullicola]|uniref:Transcriptional repressor n=1 Tax=Candidatus Acutalibacter pullicola TaxID=2838417 RepID=A0A9D2MT05_9FIRM|nr:transcriptional repressor [Candidatus Acutalibacter pullicola]
MEKRENFSRKRMAILNALQETDVHPTADWVYARLKPRYPNLSLGTVYRNLKKFCENGRAVSVGVINGQEHFDGRVDPHAHFVCKQCGAVLDVPEEFFQEEDFVRLFAKYRLQVENARVLFEGLCPQCQESERDIAL